MQERVDTLQACALDYSCPDTLAEQEPVLHSRSGLRHTNPRRMALHHMVPVRSRMFHREQSNMRLYSSPFHHRLVC